MVLTVDGKVGWNVWSMESYVRCVFKAAGNPYVLALCGNTFSSSINCWMDVTTKSMYVGAGNETCFPSRFVQR